MPHRTQSTKIKPLWFVEELFTDRMPFCCQSNSVEVYILPKILIKSKSHCRFEKMAYCLQPSKTFAAIWHSKWSAATFYNISSMINQLCSSQLIDIFYTSTYIDAKLQWTGWSRREPNTKIGRYTIMRFLLPTIVCLHADVSGQTLIPLTSPVNGNMTGSRPVTVHVGPCNKWQVSVRQTSHIVLHGQQLPTDRTGGWPHSA